MKNIILLIAFTSTLAMAQFNSGTTKQIDEIKNNTGTDILLNPTDKVDINYFTGSKALQSTVDGELEESAITNTELNNLSGSTSNIQDQIDTKAPLIRTLTTTAPLTIDGGASADLSSDRTFAMPASATAQDGYLSSTDWNTFNDKQDTLPLDTDGDLLYYNSGLSKLGIGTNGQLLRVSALGFPEWADVISVSVTTKGDIQTYSTEPDRLPVGTDSQILSANSATATGLEWIDLPISSPITTEGDLSIGDAAGDPIRLPIGTANQLLTSNGTTAAWLDAPVSTTLTTKGDIQTFDTANAALPVGANNSFLVADSAEATGLKWSDSITGLISQAQFVGSLTYQSANCVWDTSSLVWANFPTDSDCVASNIVGDIAAPDTAIPAVKIISPRTDGYYEIKASGLKYFGSGSSCKFTLSSDGTDQGKSRLYVDADGRGDNTLIGNFKFDNNADKEVRILAIASGSTPSCQVYGNSISQTLTVHFFPDSNSLAAVQNKTLNAETANELSATIVGTTATLSNYSWIDTITKSGAGKFNVNFVSGVFSTIPSCVASVTNPNGTRQSSISTATTSVARVNITDSSGTPTDDNFTIQCSKQGADVNKSQVITGTFEGINSSELSMVRGLSNAGGSVTANNPFPFTEISDSDNSWDGSTFTAKRDMRIQVVGSVRISSSAGMSIFYYVNGSGGDRCNTDVTTTATSHRFNCVADLNAGDTFHIGSNSATFTLVASSIDHWIYITESATTESIIKNLNDNNNVSCQIKLLNTSTTSGYNGVLADLTFSNLTVGKKYRATLNTYTKVQTNNQYYYQIRHNGGTIAYLSKRSDDTNFAFESQQANTGLFQAENVAVSFNIGGTISGTQAIGGGGKVETWAELCEYPDSYQLTTEFN